MGTLCLPCHEIGQGQPRAMVYIHFVELLPLMLHARFQNRRPSGSGGEDLFIFLARIYSHGGHLVHVTLTININFYSPITRILHIKFGFDWLSGY